jgi:hypothetical protein
MYSKSLRAAMLLAPLLAACASMTPWRNEPVGQEVNLAMVVRNNLLYVTSATINNRAGSFLFGSAEVRTVIDSRFASATPAADGFSLQIGGKQSLNFTPVTLDLQGVGDAIIGADVWGTHAVTIDYRAGLLTFQREGIHPELMTIYRFGGPPTVRMRVGGRDLNAIVDTSSPDTLVLPRGTAAAGRSRSRVNLAGVDFGDLDVRLDDVAAPRVGNRILSKFLVTVDYGRREVGLWRDPRTPL